MAGTSRTRVYIDADADALEREIRRAEAALERLGREGSENARQAARGMSQATAATSRYARVAAGAATVTSRVGSAARTAAPYLGGGLALGLAKSVAEAREAEKAMSQTEAVIKSTGGVANVTADDIGNLSAALSTKTAVDDEAIQSGANLLLTFKNIRNEAGKNNDIFDQSTEVILDMSAALDQDLKSSAIQVGKALNDPKVGLTALSRVGVTFTEQTKEQITALVEQGDTLKAQKIILGELTSEFGGSAAAQADSFDRLQVAAENFAESIGNEVTPTLSVMSDELADILGDKKLSKDEKIDALGDFFVKWVGNGIEALEDAGPEIARTGAELGLKAIKGFVSAWWESDLLGKLFLGAGALRLFGGPGVFGKLGVAMAKKMSGPMATTIATEMAAGQAAGGAGGPMGKPMLNWAKKAIKYAGPLAAGYFAVEWAKDLRDNPSKYFSNLTGALEIIVREAGDMTELELFRMVRIAKESGQEITKAQVKAWEKSGAISQDEAKKIRRAIHSVDVAAKDSNTVFDRWSDQIWGDFDKGGKASGRFADRTDKNLARAEARANKMAKGVAGSVSNMVNATAGGLDVLGDNLNEALGQFDVKPVAFAFKKVSAAVDSVTNGYQSGGSVFQVPGHGSGDSFHTAVPSGSFILNREAAYAYFGLQSGGMVPVALEPGELAFSPEAVAQMGGLLQAMNSSVPRFAKGGGVGGLNFALGPYDIPPIAYAADHAGSNSHVHITGTTTPWVVGIGKKLQGMGFDVSEHPAFGGVAPPPVHSLTGGHYDALAIDVNSADGESRADVSRIASILGGGGAAAQRLKRILLRGPDGPLKSIGQGALDKAHRGANAYLSANMPTGVAPTGKVSGNSVVGSATWFTGTDSASGLNPSTTPGLALNPNPGGPDPGSWDNATTRRWLAARQKFQVNIGGRSAVLPVIDLGPAGWTGHAIDVTPPGVQALGFTTANFPSGTKGTATPIGRMRGGFATGGMAPPGGRGGKGKPGFATKPGKGAGPGLGIGVPVFEPVPIGKLPGVNAPVLSYEERMTAINIALATAEPTETTADDLAALADQADLILDEKIVAEAELANLSLTAKEKEQIRKQAEAKAAALQKKLAKDGLTAKERKQIQREGQRAAKELQEKALGEKRASLLSKIDELTGALTSNHDAVLALGEEEAARQAEEAARQQEMVDALKSLSEALVAANELAKQEASIQSRELTRAIADLISGEIGGQAAQAGMTAGYGLVAAA